MAGITEYINTLGAKSGNTATWKKAITLFLTLFRKEDQEVGVSTMSED